MGELGGSWRAIRVVARVLFTRLPDGGAVLVRNHPGDVDGGVPS